MDNQVSLEVAKQIGSTYILHILITLVAIPVAVGLFNRFVKKADKIDDDSKKKWEKYVTDKFDEITSTLDKYCSDNHREHDELYTRVRNAENRVSVIETTHHQRGCDQPFRRRLNDSTN